MRFHGVAEGLFKSRASAAVLKVLASYSQRVYTGRELAREAKVSPMSAWRALQVLEAHGIVDRRRIGKTDEWKANEKHFVFTHARKMLEVDREAKSELFALLKKFLPLEKIEKIFLFGSVARGEERPSSDVDVLVVIKNKRDKQKVLDAANDAAMEAFGIFGNQLSVIAFSTKEFNRQDKNLFKEVLKEGALVFQG